MARGFPASVCAGMPRVRRGGRVVTEPRRPSIAPEFLEILACPIDLGRLELRDDRLACSRCGTKYRIEADGIPNLLIDAAELPAGAASHTEIEGWKQRNRPEL